jgi:KaiC/GvpD/RAD55 family RecA-like ATPase
MSEFQRTNNSKIKKIRFKIDFLDKLLPEGFPSNSFIIFSGEGGISKSFILRSILFSFIKRKYIGIYLCADEHPLSAYQYILQNKNGKSYVEQGKVILVDLFSYNLNFPSLANNKISTNVVIISHNKRWGEILSSIITLVDSLFSKNPKIIIIIDSLTEIAYNIGINQALDLVKVLRMEICKKRNIPIFASLHFGIRTFEEFEQIVEYIADGIFDLRYDPILLQKGFLVKQIRIRKIRNASHGLTWHSFIISKDTICAWEYEEKDAGGLNTKVIKSI